MAVLFAAIVALNAVDPGIVVQDPGAIRVGALVVLAATVVAVVVTVWPQGVGFAQIVPAVDFIAIGLLLIDTPIGGSAYAVLIILPIVWLSAERGRRFIVYSVFGAGVTVLIPLFAGNPVVTSAPELLRLVFAGVVFVIAAVIVNELSLQARQRTEAVRALAERTVSALEETASQAQELATREAQLALANDLFRQVWEAVTEQCVIGTDTTGLIDLWNPGAERMLRLPAQSVVGVRRVGEFHLPSEIAERRQVSTVDDGAAEGPFLSFVDAVRSTDGAPSVWTYVRSDGSEVPVEVTVTYRRDLAGKIVGCLFVAHDISRTLEANRIKDEFVGLVSHELRTPLSSILGYLELLRDEDDDPATLEIRTQYLDVIERNSRRLLRLVGDLLLAAQIESESALMQMRPLDLEPIVWTSIESARPKLAAAEITVEPRVEQEVWVRGDVLRLGQVVDNLLSNAIKFTPSGGRITVTLACDVSSAMLVIEDTGMGIAVDELEKLFGRFFRASTATRNAVPGIGLGLTITKTIVEAHGGTIAVSSTEGEGTRFTVTLPAIQRAT